MRKFENVGLPTAILLVMDYHIEKFATCRTGTSLDIFKAPSKSRESLETALPTAIHVMGYQAIT